MTEKTIVYTYCVQMCKRRDLWPLFLNIKTQMLVMTRDKILRMTKGSVFTQVANTAQKRKEEFDQRFSALEKARKAAVKPVVKVNKEKINSVRYAVWLVMAGVIALWFMYMTGGA